MGEPMKTRRTPARPLRAAVIFVSLCVSTAAHAEGPQDPSKGEHDATDIAFMEAQRRLHEGLARYSKGDFDGARLAFEQAYTALPSIDLLYNLAYVELKSGHPLEALGHAHRLLHEPKATEADRAKAEKLLVEGNRVTGHVMVEGPAGAEIRIDHETCATAPTTEPCDVMPGTHVVELHMPARAARTIEVEAQAGIIVTARFAVEAAPVEAPPTPSAPFRPETPHRNSRARIIVPATLGGLGIAALAVGIGMGLASQGEETQAANFRASHAGGFCFDRTSTYCQQYAAILNSQQQDTNASRVLLVSGGVLAAASIVSYLAWPKPRTELRAWITPTLGGFVAGGTF